MKPTRAVIRLPGVFLLVLLAPFFLATSPAEEAPACTRLPLGEDVVKWLAPDKTDHCQGFRAIEQDFLCVSLNGLLRLDAGGKAKWIAGLGGEHPDAWACNGLRCIVATGRKDSRLFIGLSCQDGQILWKKPMDQYEDCVPIRGGTALLGIDAPWWCLVDNEGKTVFETKECHLYGFVPRLATWNDRISVGRFVFNIDKPYNPSNNCAFVSSQTVGSKDYIAPMDMFKADTDYDREHMSDGRGIAASEKLVAYCFGSRTMFCPASKDVKMWTERFAFNSAVFLGDHLVCAGKTVLIYDAVAHSWLNKIGNDDDCRIWPVDDTKCVFVRQGKAVGYVSPESPLGKEFPFADKVFAATIVGNSLVCLTADSLVTFQLPDKK